MAHRVEHASSINIEENETVPTRRYTFFPPRDLWIGDTFDQNHEAVFEESGHREEDLDRAVAGYILRTHDQLSVDGNGSSAPYYITRKDPKPVVNFIRSLKGRDRFRVVAG